jgi:translocation and assembly module TamB
VPEQWAGQVLKTFGTLHFEGSAERYQAQGRVRLGPPERLSNIELDIEGTPERVHLQQFDIVQVDGRLAAQGTVDLSPVLGWDMAASAKSFNPGEFATGWPGDLNFSLTTQGALPEGQPTASLALTELRGTLRGRALSGRAELDLAANKVISGVADIRSGKSRVQLQAKPGDVMDALATIDVPALDDWLPNTAGSVQGRFTALGNWPETTIAGEARANSLAINDLRAASLQLELDVETPTQPKGTLTLAVKDATAAGMQIDSMTADARGDAAAHALNLELRGSPLGTQLALEGSQSESGWRGSMNTLVLDIQNAARLALQRPVQIVYDPEQSRISEACFADGDIRLCLEGALRADGSLDASYLLQDLPFALANAFAGADSGLAFDGTIGGEGKIARNAEGALSGTARLQSARGQIARELAEGEAADVLLSFTDLNLHANLEGERASAEVSARLDETGSLNGRLGVSGLNQPVSQLDGSIQARLPSIAVVELFAPQIANVKGAVDLRAAIRGRSDDPTIEGELRLSELAADVPDVGLKLRNGVVAVRPRTDDAYSLEGGIQSGDGTVAFAGVLRLSGASNVTITGKQFLAADLPGARVLVEPDLIVEHTAERLNLKGKLTIPEAAINLQELPRGSGGGGAKISSDVVIVDAQTQEEEATQSLPIYADITVVVGDDVEIVGFGLTAQVRGQLAVQERPGAPTSGSGEVNVAGQYKAYGQDLTIREGRLLFANSPLDNPNLNLTAVRVVEDVTAGLRVTGSAKNPVLTVFSDPVMAQTEALSYLVAGKPLDQIRQNEGEGDALQTAARSLGTAAGGLLAKNVGKRLGIDEFGIKDNEMIGGAAFTVGQYLSPRLYLSYGVGLFEPGEVVTLRYKLTESVALQAQSGTDESRAGVEYRMER